MILLKLMSEMCKISKIPSIFVKWLHFKMRFSMNLFSKPLQRPVAPRPETLSGYPQ